MFEWFNEILPQMNTAGVTDMALLRVGPTATGVDLRTIFGNRTGVPTGGADISPPSGAPNIDSGHFYTIKADGAGGSLPSGVANPWRAYIGLAATVRAVDETSPTGICWPLLDGQQIRARMAPATRDRATGAATLFPSPVLNFKAAAGAGTGWLRIYRSSLGEGQQPGIEWPKPGMVT